MAATTRLNLATLSLLAFSLGGQLPAAAEAPATATVSVVKSSNAGSEDTEARLVYRAGAGEANQLDIATDAASANYYDPVPWIVRETGRNTVTDQPIVLAIGPGCTSIDTQTAVCSPNLSEAELIVDVRLGDSDDSATVEDACGYRDGSMDYTCEAVVRGGEGNDVLFANHFSPNNDHASWLYGQEGHDELYAGMHSSVIFGGPGNDTLIGSALDDNLLGNGGDDSVAARASDDTVVGGYGDDLIRGGQGHDTLHADAGEDTVRGEDGHDVIVGGDEADELSGGRGDDTVTGGRGRDLLRGARGRDTLYARDSMRDEVQGGLGIDRARLDSRDEAASVERRF